MTTVADPVGLAELAERLGVPRQTAKTWRQRGQLPEPEYWVSGAPAWEWDTIVEWCKATDRERYLS